MTTAAGHQRSARQRILDTASELFYRDGYHAVGIDTIVERSGVAKMTLYRHFPSKDDLIAAYLERGNDEFWDWLDGETGGLDDPRARLLAAFDGVSKLATSPRCLGCTFQAAASEFPDPCHPGHRVAIAHKRRVLERLAELGRDAGVADPDGLASQLLLLMDGAWAAARMFGPHNHATSAAAAARTLIEAHLGAPADRAAADRATAGRATAGRAAAGRAAADRAGRDAGTTQA